MDVMLTRHYSGFSNREDRYSLGNNENEGRASASSYALPDGYAVDRDAHVIRDPDGIECAIVSSVTGPMLMSMAGTRPDVRLTHSA